jgi:Co/Zn/Cd efflux system component
LLDRAADPDLQQQVRACFEQEEGLQVCDLHLWMVAPGRYALIASLQTPAPKALAYYQNLLAGLPALVHVTIEVNACPEALRAPA